MIMISIQGICETVMSPSKEPALSLALNLTLHDAFSSLLSSEMGLHSPEMTTGPDANDYGARALVAQVTKT